jgi:hypothetical protein
MQRIATAEKIDSGAWEVCRSSSATESSSQSCEGFVRGVQGWPRFRSDDFPDCVDDFFAGHLNSGSRRFTRSHGVCERGSPWCFRFFDRRSFDLAAEDRVPLFKAIEGHVQLFDYRLGFIFDDDQFHVDLSINHIGVPVLQLYACSP